MFGKNKNNIEFDARKPPEEILSNPQSFSYVHNFKVHYKHSSLQLLADKLDVSVSTKTPQVPPGNWVMNEFNWRMKKSRNRRGSRQGYDPNSYHVTNIEYTESLATRFDFQNATSVKSVPAQKVMVQAASTYCPSCGGAISAESKFCSKCGTAL